MDPATASELRDWRFDGFTVSPGRREITLDGSPVALGSRAFDVLVALVQRRDRVVTKSELLDLAWPGLVVEENNLQVQISTLRKLLGPHAIATVPGRGYRFTAALADDPAVDEAPPAAPQAGVTPAPSRGNLSSTAPQLFGRDDDLDTLCRMVRDHRAVSIAGAGGIGKTRLALAAAHRLREHFADGAWFVELAPVSDPALVGAAVVRDLGLSVTGASRMVDEIAAALQERRLLLVLDNCEHVLDAAAGLAEALVERTRGVHLIATSQELLRVPQEQVFRLQALGVPPTVDDLPAARRSGAVSLFVARVGAQQPGFDLTPTNNADIVEICRRLDGLPLAIELAAARAAQLGVVSVRERLDERFRVLTGGSRLALRRHQTLREMLDWSHALLDDETAMVFRRAGVFAGGFTLSAAQDVLADERIDRWDVLEHVAALVDKSLVVADPGEPPRYRLLETMRAYALEKLRDAGETRALLERHGCWVRSLFEEFEAQDWQLPTQVRLERAVPEIDNLRAALDWSEHEPGQDETFMSLAANSRWMWFRTGLRAEGLRRLGVAMQRLSPQTPAQLAAEVRMNWAHLSYPNNGPQERQAIEDAIVALRRLGDRRALFKAVVVQGRIASFTNHKELCVRAADEAAQVFDPEWPESAKWQLLNTQALVPYYAGRPQEALPQLREGLAIAQRVGDTVLTCVSLMYLEQVAEAQGNWEEAVIRGQELIALKSSQRFGSTVGMEQSNLSLALTRLGRLDEARAVALQSIAAHTATGTLWTILECVALLAVRRGHFRAGALALGRSDVAGIRNEGVREPNEARAYADALAELRAALAPAELAALIDRAAGMTDAEAIGVALADTDAA